MYYSEAKAKVERSRSGQPKIGHNTTVRAVGLNGETSYAIRYHATDVVTLHPDGTYSLNTGGWHTHTTMRRLNDYSPARVCSDKGQLYVWHASDPKTPVKMQKCRTCHGEGQTFTAGYTYKPWGFENGQYVQQEPVTVADRWNDCYRCNGSGQADYGSKPRPVEFFDGITVDGTGRVVSPGTRRYPTPEEIAERKAAERKAEAARKRAERKRMRDERTRFLADYGLEVRGGKVTVFKAVDHDLQSGHRAWHLPDRMAYPIGRTVTAPDWDGAPRCGGGLHFGPTPRVAASYYGNATRYLACEVDAATMVVIDDKVKAESCRVLYEVDSGGNRL